jgi:hypothetical protein
MVPDHSVTRALLVYVYRVLVDNFDDIIPKVFHGVELVYHDPYHVIEIFGLVSREVEPFPSSHEPCDSVSFGLARRFVCV